MDRLGNHADPSPSCTVCIVAILASLLELTLQEHMSRSEECGGAVIEFTLSETAVDVEHSGKGNTLQHKRMR